jgi:anti-sigma regulatory factor (Ser/Thr protein kinase)
MNPHARGRQLGDAHARATTIATESNPMDDRCVSLEMTVDSTALWSSRRADLHKWVSRCVGHQPAQDALLACGEAVDNAFEHGRTPVSVELTCESRDRLEIVVRDRGNWRVSATTPPRGLGLPIMTRLMDNVTIDTTDGTVVRLSLRLPATRKGRT